jgi:hypothetical protein
VNELEGVWKEAVVALFKVPSRNLLGGPQENHEREESCFCRCSNWGPPGSGHSVAT